VGAQARTADTARSIGTPEWTTLRTLAARQFESPVAVSLFLDLHPADTPTPPAAATRVNALLDQAIRQLDDLDELVHHDARIARAAVERGAGQLRAVARDERPVHGLAAYAAADGFTLTLRLTDAVPDRAAVATTFRVRPVASVRARSTDALLVHVGRKLGQIYLLHDGAARMLDDLTIEVPRRHDQGGWSQARFQRSIDRETESHLDDVAQRLDDLTRRDARPIVLLGPHEVQADLTRRLGHDGDRSSRHRSR
jgi:peptide chain release factor subunit 1